MPSKTLYQNLPDSPGVYLMKDAAGRVLYVGKAGNLKRRVSSYFLRPHDYRIERLVGQIAKIDYQKTDTAIEALILEAELIKKLEPPFNVREKDDKSFLYVEFTPLEVRRRRRLLDSGKSGPLTGFTKETFPRVLLVRGKSKPGGERYGPFTSAGAIREALRILRHIFPYSTHSSRDTNIRMRANDTNKRPCFEYEIGLCPGTCIGAISKTDYAKNIRNLKLFFEGKKARILKNLEREMAAASKKLEFEKAAKLRGQIFALKHIQDVALIAEGDVLMTHDERLTTRIEGYDISNISGTSAVGSMVVFTNGKSDTNEYRKFKIHTITQSDDVGMLKEVLRRRFAHRPKEGGWPLPDLILIDGGKGQVNTAKQVLNEAGLKIPIIGIAKGPERKRNDVIGFTTKWADKKTLIRVRDEAHRFAIQYHKKLRAARSLT